MERWFVSILNMSVTASIVIVVVMVLRLLLKNIPRKFSYYLWGIVLIRLLVPVLPTADFGLTSDIKLVKLQKEVVAEAESNLWNEEGTQSVVPDEGKSNVFNENGMQKKDTLIYSSKVSVTKNTEEESEAKFWDSGENILEVVSCVWLAGTIILVLYGIGSYIILKYKYSVLCQKGDTIIISRQVATPFVMGVFHPIIFLPTGLSREQQSLVIAHEKIHIKRKDLFVKTLYFLARSIHWFNPLVWIAFYLMEQDMEVSCDEAVLQKADTEQKKLYARTLILFAHASGVINNCPVAFGENSTKTRIKHAVKMKKSASWAVAIGAIVIALAAGFLLVNRTDKKAGVTDIEDMQELPVEMQPRTEVVEKVQIMEKTEILEEEVQELQAEEEALEVLLLAEKEEKKVEDEKQSIKETLGNEEKDSYKSILRDKEGIYNEFGIFYQSPIQGAKISDTYGVRVHPVTGEERIHSGVDYVAEKGTAVLAAAEGTVYETGFDVVAGNYVILLHGNGEMTYYANCDTILTEVSKEVKVGEQIATVGSTGAATGAHLYFALSYQGKYIEPIISEGNSSILTCD